MALNVMINKRPDLYIVPPVIDFNKFVRSKREMTVCPICGKLFQTRFFLDNPNPERGMYCPECSRKIKKRNKINQIKERVDMVLLSNFLKEKEELITRAAASAVDNQNYYTKNCSFDDLKHEGRIACLMYFFRCAKKNISPLSYDDAFYYMMMRNTIRRGQYAKVTLGEDKIFEHDEESTFKEIGNKRGFEENVRYFAPADSIIDAREILSKIVKLSKTDSNVKLALEKGYCFQSFRDFDAGRYLKEKYNLTSSQLFKKSSAGLEHIYCNDAENINAYIDINNLNAVHKFNQKDAWSVEDLKAFYKGTIKCKICGKEFAPPPKHKSLLRIGEGLCGSEECKREYNRIKTAQYRARKKGRN